MTTTHEATRQADGSRAAVGEQEGREASLPLAAPATKSQNDKVLRMLLDRWDGITSLDAITELGCTRLAARISDLKEEGHDIRSEMVKVPNRDGQLVRVARYRLRAA